MIPILLITRDAAEMPSFAVSDGSDTTIEDNDGNVAIEVSTPPGPALTISVARQNILPDGDVAGPKVYSIDGDSTVWIGPWPPAVFNDPSNRVVFTAEAGVGLRGLRW